MNRQIKIVSAAAIVAASQRNGTATPATITEACEHFCLPVPENLDTFTGVIGSIENGDLYEIQVTDDNAKPEPKKKAATFKRTRKNGSN